MRSFVATMIVLCVVCSLLLLNKHRPSTLPLHPSPTETIAANNSEKNEFRRQREAWIESLHRCAPGVDWRSINSRTRAQRTARTLALRQELARRGDRILGGVHQESIANGALQGLWREVGSNNQAGRILRSDVDLASGTLYAASAGGNIWIGDLEGQSWRSINDYLQFSGIVMLRALSRGAAMRIVVVKNSPAEVYFTDDEGQSWEKAQGLDRLSNWGSFARAIATPRDGGQAIYAHGVEWDNASGGPLSVLYKSVDLGANFKKVAARGGNNGIRDFWLPRYDNGDAYLVAADTLLRLDANDQLRHAGILRANLNFNAVRNLYLSGSQVGGRAYLYTLYRTSDSLYLYASTNGGASWSYRGSPPQGPFNKTSFSCSNKDPDLVYCGGVNAYRSFDGGRNWTIVNQWAQYYGDPTNKLHADIPEILSIPADDGSELIMISSDGGIYISRDSLQTVRNLSLQGLRVSQYYASYTHRDDPNVVYAGSQDQGYQRALVDSGSVLDFEQIISGDYSSIVSSDRGQSVWMVYPTFAQYYSDAAGSNRRQAWTFQGRNYFWLPPLMASPDRPDEVFLGGGGSEGGARLWRLDAAGRQIVASEGLFDFGNGNNQARIGALAYSPLNSDYRYVLTNMGRFFVSSDGGDTWTMTPELPGAPGSHYLSGSTILASPNQLGRVYIAGSGYSNPAVYVSDNHGQDFRPMNEGLPATLVFKMALTPDESMLFAATQVGPYVFLADRQQWYDLAGITGPDQTYWHVDYIPNLRAARFSTYGRGLWDFRIGPLSCDAGVAALHPPATGPCPLGAGETVSVSISNYGEIPIDELDLKVEVEGTDEYEFVEAVTEIGLLPGQTKDYALRRTFDFSRAGEYRLKIAALVDGDSETDNDAASALITILDRPEPLVSNGLEPPSNSADLALPLSLQWNFSTNADSYDLFVWPAGEDRPEFPIAGDLTATSYTLTDGLQYGTSYSWQVTAKNQCHAVTGEALRFTLRDSLRITAVEAKEPGGADLRLQPNPAVDATTLHFSLSQSAELSLIVYDMHGRELFRRNGIMAAAGRQQFVWRTLDKLGQPINAGTYFLQLMIDGRPIQRTLHIVR